jgi:subtilisin family serine protease
MRILRYVLLGYAVAGLVGAYHTAAVAENEKLSAGVGKDFSTMVQRLSQPSANEASAAPQTGKIPERQRRFLVTAQTEREVSALLDEIRNYADNSGVYFGRVVYIDTHNPLALLANLRANQKVSFVEEWSELGRPPISSPPTVPFNLNAQLTHNVVKLRDRYKVNGSSVTVGIWDEGPVLATHLEFGGRVEVRDKGNPSDHATHVAGTIGAQGLERTAEGMAPGVKLISYDWNDDLIKLNAIASGPVHITNHSYGQLRGWSYSYPNGTWLWNGNPAVSEEEDYLFGKYVTLSRLIDELVFNRPELSVVVAAGNDRSTTNDPNTVRGWDGVHLVPSLGQYITRRRPPNFAHGGYDTLQGYGVAKNVITVGAIEDMPLGVDGMPPDAVRPTAFSSWGPPDDGRIKPDIVANGSRLYSPVVRYSSGRYDTRAYGYKSGTSMASPAVTGIAALLTEVSSTKRGKGLRADEMKAALIHTAVSPQSGPSYQTGWGGVNALAAGELIAGDSGMLRNDSIKPDGAGKLRLRTIGGPIRVTLTWIDPPATPNAGGLNDRRPALVHDLDLVVTDPAGKRHYPWSLDPDHPDAAATHDRPNDRDNVERVDVEAPDGGIWTIDVTGPEAARGDTFALAISGLKLVQ